MTKFDLAQQLPPVQPKPENSTEIVIGEPIICDTCSGCGKGIVTDEIEEDEYGSWHYVPDNKYYITECLYCKGTGYWYKKEYFPAITIYGDNRNSYYYEKPEDLAKKKRIEELKSELRSLEGDVS